MNLASSTTGSNFTTPANKRPRSLIVRVPTTLSHGRSTWGLQRRRGHPEQGSFHAGFTLSSAADRFFLVRDPAGAADVLDSVEFTDLATEVAAARTPDGAKDWWVTENVTPGAANAAP